MKNILIILALATAISSAQETRRPSPPPAPRVVDRSQARPGPAPDRPVGLKENITLHLHGSFQGFVPLDLELTGTGPVFNTDLINKADKEGDQPTIITFQATISLNPDDTYRIEYTLGARIAMVTSTMSRPGGGAITSNVEYRDIALNGTAKLTDGKPLVISKLNGEALSLTISKAKE